MRILYLTADPGIPVFGGKGASVHVRALTAAFAGLGHEVMVASPRIEPGEERLPASVRCAQIPAVRPRDVASEADVVDAQAAQAEAVSRLARELRADCIYERYSLSSCAGARSARALEIPLLVEVNAPLREEERRFRQLAHERAARSAEAETFASATMIVAVSRWLRDWLISQGVDPQRLEVIPNPPPAELFADRGAPAEHAPLCAGFCGSLKPWHGVETLVEAFRKATDAGARMELEIVGDGPAAAVVDAAIGASDRIRRLGQIPHREVVACLERWDIGVAPYSLMDGFYFSPLKLSEYMAAGVCPVVSAVGPLPGLVDGGRAGVIVPADDPEALAGALLGLDRDRARLRRLAAEAQSIARAQPSWTQVAERLAAVLAGATVAGSAVAR
ncbi:MAG: glycosyltransferase family 4 protein [Acidobacteriota bacterium]|nr:glycosyltransferase family 4 protein [Acidobacteriota bacterium]